MYYIVSGEKLVWIVITSINFIGKSILFLHRIGLITITPISDNLEDFPNVYKDLMTDSNKINYKDELFSSFNICIKYPMFYVGILKDILGFDMPDKLHPALLGSIVECNVRGILPERGALEYHDFKDNEVDYVNIIDNVAIEITVSNKNCSQVHFDCLPEGFERIMLSKDVKGNDGDIRIVPYYEYLCSLTL